MAFDLASLIAELQAEIVASRAQTVAGLVAKAQRVLWCRGGSLYPEMETSPDVTMMLSVIADLLSLAD